MLQARLATAPERSGSVSRPAQGRSWTAPGCSWFAQGVLRLALERHLGVQEPSRARLDASPKRLRASKTAQDQILVDFGLVCDRFSSIFERSFVDIRSSRVRRRHKSRILKRNCVIFSTRFDSCDVDFCGVSSDCSHVCRNDFRMLHVQPFFVACPQAHLVF